MSRKFSLSGALLGGMLALSSPAVADAAPRTQTTILHTHERVLGVLDMHHTFPFGDETGIVRYAHGLLSSFSETGVLTAMSAAADSFQQAVDLGDVHRFLAEKQTALTSGESSKESLLIAFLSFLLWGWVRFQTSQNP